MKRWVVVAILALGSGGAAQEEPSKAKYVHISDADLFAALDLDRPALARVKAAVDAADYPAAYRAWVDYWGPKGKLGLIDYDGELRPAGDVEKILRADPAKVESCVKGAEPVMCHNITGWGTVTKQHGDVVDFNFDYGESGKYGFHYWGWSDPVLTAWHATGDAKYLAEFDRLFNQWYEQREKVKGAFPNLDVIWYELGLGLRNRRFLGYYECAYPDRPLVTHERLLKTALGAARWLFDLQSRGYRPGNWQIMGSYGLLDIAARLPEFRDSGRWLETGVARLQDHMDRDFYDDGCHSERAPTSYMTIAYRDPREALTLVRAAGVKTEATARFGARLEKALEWWMWAATPLGGLPALNDGGSRSLPANWMKADADLYGRRDIRAVVERLVDGKKDVAGLPATASRHLEPSGAAVMRSGWDREASYLFVNYGTHGAWHSHRATLDFELYGQGVPLALDAGIGTTYDDPLHAPWYAASRSHNMLVVDDDDLDRSAARAKDVLWHSDARIDVFGGTHDGYAKSHGVRHRRVIAFVKPDVFVVFDTCAVEADGRVLSWYFHSPTELVTNRVGSATGGKGPGVLLREVSTDRLKVRRGRGMCALSGLGGGYKEIDWIALDRFAQRGSDNRFTVLLMPFAKEVPEVEFAAAPSPAGTSCVTLKRGGRADTLIFGNGESLSLLDGRLVTDGRFAWMREEGGARAGTVVGGKTLTWEGGPLAPPEE